MTQIDLFSTFHSFIYERIREYDPDITNIRVFGILDDNNKCSNPYFMMNDVIKYLKTDASIFTGYNTNEIVELQINGITHNMLTKYGLIRTMLFTKDTAGIALRHLVYSWLDSLDPNMESTVNRQISDNYRNFMETPEVQDELKQTESNSNVCVYFIKNTITNRVKIGRTDGPVEDKLSQLQTGNDCPLIVHRVIECGAEFSETLAHILHERFAEFHIRGEWYNITDEQIGSV